VATLLIIQLRTFLLDPVFQDRVFDHELVLDVLIDTWMAAICADQITAGDRSAARRSGLLLGQGAEDLPGHGHLRQAR